MRIHTLSLEVTVKTLIVVDVQNDFCEGGSLAVAGGAEAAFRIGGLLHQWQEADEHARRYDLIVATRDHHIDPGDHFSAHPDFTETWPPHCVVGTDGAAFHPNLDPQPFHAIFLKGEYAAAYSGFDGKTTNGSGLRDWLGAHHVTAVDVCGIATDVCVRHTALDAHGAGFATRVLTHYTAGVTPEATAAALEQMRTTGVGIVDTA